MKKNLIKSTVIAAMAIATIFCKFFINLSFYFILSQFKIICKNIKHLITTFSL